MKKEKKKLDEKQKQNTEHFKKEKGKWKIIVCLNVHRNSLTNSYAHEQTASTKTRNEERKKTKNETQKRNGYPLC